MTRRRAVHATLGNRLPTIGDVQPSQPVSACLERRRTGHRAQAEYRLLFGAMCAPSPEPSSDPVRDAVIS